MNINPFFENVPGLYLLLTPDLIILNASNSYLNATMTNREMIIGKKLFDVFPDNPNDSAANGELNLRASLSYVLKHKTEHTMAVQKYDIREPDGTFVVKYWSPRNKPVLDIKNEIQYIIHRVEDVTDYVLYQQHQEKEGKKLSQQLKEKEWDIIKRSEEIQKLNSSLEQLVVDRSNALIEKEKHFRNAMDNMLEGMQIVGADWRYLYVNDSAAKHGKTTKEELLGFTMMEKYPGIEKTDFFKVLEECMTNKISRLLVNEFLQNDNSKGWFQLSIQPTTEGLLIFSADITQQKLAEEKIIQFNEELEKKVIERTAQLESVNKELESFSYSVSHDLRAPLRSINGFSQILIENFAIDLNDEAKRLLKIITNNAKKMGQLIDDLLAFSRFGKQKLSVSKLQMKILIDEIIEELGNEVVVERIKINIETIENAVGDKVMIKQVLVNLISNAIKYSSKKEKAVIEIGSYSENDYVVYYVKDNGAGFDMNYYDKLFGIFQRLHSTNEFEGTGVGLSIAQRIILKHDGKIWADAKINEGATFYFSLPKNM